MTRSTPRRPAGVVRSGRARREEGIVLAIVLVMTFALVTAVYTFQRRAILDATIAANRLDAAEADALARGGLRVAQVLLTVVRAKQSGAGAAPQASGLGGDEEGQTPSVAIPFGGDGESDTAAIEALWQNIGQASIDVGDGRTLRIEIEDEGAKLNLNALVPASALPPAATGNEDDDDEEEEEEEEEEDALSNSGSDESGEDSAASEEAVEYLTAVLEYVINGMEPDEDAPTYDPKAIAENILDFIDGDRSAQNGRSEDAYYRRQDPPYRAWNQPLVSIEQLALVEDVDARLLRELRHYMTVHPIGSTQGINLNRAEPWVLKLVFAGNSGNRRLIDDRLAEALFKLRDEDQLVCDGTDTDPRCVGLADVGSGELGNGGIYPPVALPVQPTVFRVVATASVGDLVRRIEAIYDTRTDPGPQLLSWRRLRGAD